MGRAQNRHRTRRNGAINCRVHRRHSPQSLGVSVASRLLIKNFVRVWALQPDVPWPFEYVDAMAGLLPRRWSDVKIERVELQNCTAEWVRAPGVSSNRAILYFHGGAFLTCGLNTHRSLVVRLSKAANAPILTVGYRKLPSSQITDAIDDGLTGLRWLHDRGYGGDRIVVAGDSAGGYLAFMTTLSAIKSRLATPAGVAAISPFTNPDPAPKLKHRNARRCSMFTSAAFTRFARFLGEAPLRDKRGITPDTITAPVDADLSMMPPVTIHASSDELLLPDAELMAQRLSASGIRCDLHLWEGQIHDFPIAADILPEGRRAVYYIGEFIQEVTAGSGQHVAAAAG
ncbi:esterase [Mycobacterium kubicae]|uniref:alpha/beta hydrolase n=1 Tax=Mycobacterium kubicae TaxID=120959 RepID=UPI0007FC3E37|nr:alpha/beta hydrolase [Mycobacterium kubicae]OBF21055.1 esterase [Mycobacterium kubicae]